MKTEIYKHKTKGTRVTLVGECLNVVTLFNLKTLHTQKVSDSDFKLKYEFYTTLK